MAALELSGAHVLGGPAALMAVGTRLRNVRRAE